jgi:hypothetical protein
MSEDKPADVKAEEAPEADAKDAEAEAADSTPKKEETMNGENEKEASKEDEEPKEEVPETTEKVDETEKDEKAETKEDDVKTEEKDETNSPKNEDSTTEVKEEDKKVNDKETATNDTEEAEEVKDEKENETKEDDKEDDKDDKEEVTTEEAKEEVESPAKTTEPSPKKTPRSGRGKNKRTSLDSLFDDSIQVPTALKRERKQVGNYAPENFKQETTVQKKFVNKVGRGKKLREFPSVKDSIARTAAKDPILGATYKLIYGGARGRSSISKKHIKSRLLDFSGYLEVPPEDADQAMIEKLDHDAESKMATRAYKMTVPLLKSLCDLFDVDRIPAEGKAVIDKDTLIDRLLDFLGAPDSKYLKTPKKKEKVTPTKKRKTSSPKSKSPTPKKKKVRKEVGKKAKEEERVYQDESETEDEMDVDSEEESEEEVAKMPTDKLLRKWVRAYVNCFNLDKATTKHAIETASDRFGVDLSGKKARIKELLTEEMS